MEEILAILPAKWARAGKLIAEMHGAELRLKRINRTGEHKAGDILRGEPVALRLHPPDILFRTFKLPRSARLRLKQILGYELTRQSPLPPDEVLHSGRVITLDQHQGQIIVVMAILRRSVADDAAARLREHGLQLTSVFAISPGCAPSHMVRFKIKPYRATIRYKSMLVLLVAAIAVLAVLNFSMLSWRDHILHENLSNELTSLDQSTSIVRQLRSEEVSLLDLRSFLKRKQAQPYFGSVVAEITKLLPDNSYLIAVNFSVQQVQIEGYAKDPSGFIGLFDSSLLFSNASFSGPITQDSTGQLRHFVITMNVTGSSP